MRWFSAFTKVVFICNLCFILAVVLQFAEVDNLPQWFVGTILTLGWFLSILLNLVFLSITCYLLISGKRLLISPVLGLLNIIISIGQFIYFFFSYDS